jgi:alpha-galactosidase
MTNDDVYVELNDESGSWSVGSGLIECQVQQTNGGNLLVDRHFPVFPGQPFVSTWSTVANEDPAPVLVTDCQILNLDVPASQPLTLFHVEQLSWVYRRDFFSQKQVQLLQGKAPAEISMGSFPSRSWVPSSCA